MDSTSGGDTYVNIHDVLTSMLSKLRPTDTLPSLNATDAGTTHVIIVLSSTRADTDTTPPKVQCTSSVPAKLRPLSTTTSPPYTLPYRGDTLITCTVFM
jgi:hypothetical protein